MKFSDAAQIVYETLAAYKREMGLSVGPAEYETLEETVRAVVRHKLTPEQIHARWVEMRRNCGWIYGHTYDLVSRTDPALVPLNEMPKEYRVKTALLHTIALSLKGYINEHS